MNNKTIKYNDLPIYIKIIRRISLNLGTLRGMRRFFEPIRKVFSNFNQEVLLDDFDTDLKYFVRFDEHMGSQIFWYGYYSKNGLLVLDQLLKHDSCFVDVGANQGEFTCYAAKRCHKVISFEPVKKIYENLKLNVEVNNFNNIQLERSAVGEQVSKLPIFTQSGLFVDSTEHMGLGTLHPFGDRNQLIEEIDIVPLDVFFDENQRIDLVKIDVEGHELSVLKGARRILDTYHPFLIIEVNEETLNAAGTTARELFSYLTEIGYKADLICRNGKYKPIDIDELRKFQDILFSFEVEK